MESFKTKESKAEAGYEIALIMNAENRPLEVVRLCERVERDFPGTHASRHAKTLRSQIQMPALYLRARTVLPPARGSTPLSLIDSKMSIFSPTTASGVGLVLLALPGSPGSRNTYQENVPTRNGVQESKTGLIIEGSQGRSILRR